MYTGNVAGPKVLNTFDNNYVTSTDEAMEKSHPHALWIAATHKTIRDINQRCLQNMVNKGSEPRRIISDHLPNKNCDIDDEIRDKLYKVQGDLNGSRYNPMMSNMILTEGSRVKITTNLAVELGLYNGAMATVVGFIYKGTLPTTKEERMPNPPYSRLKEQQREIPIVLIQLDGADNYTYSCDTTLKRIIPICPTPGPSVTVHSETKGEQKFTRVLLPILPAFGRTIHSVQGFTASNGIVLYPNSHEFGGTYVAISRARELKDVLLMEMLQEFFFTRKPSYRILVDTEYTRLRLLFPMA